MTNPRYDEQFQRGYAGPPVQPPVQPPVDAGVSASQTGAPQRQHDAQSGRPAAAGAARIVDESSEVRPADADRLGIARPFRRNPFAIALLAAGVLMVIVGVWLVEQSVKLYTDGYTPEQQTVTQFELQLAAPVLTSGVIAILAWLVLGAIIAAAHRRGA